MIRQNFRLHSSAGGVRRRQSVPEVVYEVDHIRVHPDVWEEAVRRSQMDVTRIQIISSTEVIVHNKPVTKKRPVYRRTA